MRFSLRSFLLLIAGFAIVAFLGMRFGFAFLLVLILLGAGAGALCGKRRFWLSCLLGGLGGALATWIGLLSWAYILPWNYISDAKERAEARAAYQNFVRETFVAQSAFVMVEGFVIGVVVAIVVFGLRKSVLCISRCREPRAST